MMAWVPGNVNIKSKIEKGDFQRLNDIGPNEPTRVASGVETKVQSLFVCV